MPSKTFNDPIYGPIDLDRRLVKFIDTVQFQRLHHLRQLGVAFSVYPGASHTRFEHSVGTAHLAGELLKRLEDVASPAIKHVFNQKDVLCVKIAALLHDLGHGPFSHFWEHVISVHNQVLTEENRESEKVEAFVHEEMTLKLIDVVLQENPDIRVELDLEDDDVIFIKELIIPSTRGKSNRSKEPLKNFLYEIVSNKQNGNDVDKWDYIRRDSHHVGINTSFELKRLLNLCKVFICQEKGKVVRTHIAWPQREFDNILQIFEQRKRLHKKVYQHRVIKPMERLYIELLRTANEFIKVPSAKNSDKSLTLFEAHKDPHVFVNLTDAILHGFVMYSGPKVSKCRDILNKIQTRQIGKLVCEANIDDLYCHDSSYLRELQCEFHKYLSSNQVPQSGNDNDSLLNIAEVDIQFYQTNLDFGMKGADKNPMKNVWLYFKEDLNVPASLAADLDEKYVDRMTPKKIMESNVYLFANCPDETRRKFIRDMFVKFCKQSRDDVSPLSIYLTSKMTNGVHGNESARRLNFQL
ncbi:deoxynucleoside triphosphate triphosphohydrolase SAMHD1-like [Convolutriloba macropyga]|uniref:deoxynucleoside triphosphate triphosphohydrolase SAMHD1-like n=1 Tax=Convolutriloba macropyga TaxID=536237 RepID=UPI003F51E71A